MSRDLLRRYAEGVVGFRPDFVFTHVARPVASKAIERDLAVMEHLDDILADRGQTSVLLVLATDGGRRDRQLVQHMESEYGWPLNHRVGWPDLVKGEIPIGQAAEEYNAWARSSRVVLINQFGFSRQTCGDRIPEEATFQDLRQGSDAEFGQSAYEPFGIAPLETLAFGGISVISRACGVRQLLARVAGQRLPRERSAGQLRRPAGVPCEAMTGTDSRRIEHEVAAKLARQLARAVAADPPRLCRPPGERLEPGRENELAGRLQGVLPARPGTVPGPAPAAVAQDPAPARALRGCATLTRYESRRGLWRGGSPYSPRRKKATVRGGYGDPPRKTVFGTVTNNKGEPQ